jgi:molybdenum cofactor biosynthesis protein MoaC
MNDFTHLDKTGNVKMVDVTDKVSTARMAKAEGKISMLPETILAIQNDALPKGNVLTTAKISGIQSAKKTAEMIPMCHQLNLSYVDIEFDLGDEDISIRSVVKPRKRPESKWKHYPLFPEPHLLFMICVNPWIKQ